MPLTSEGLDKDLHAAAQAQHQVQRALLLDVVVGQGAPILQLLARKDEALLVRGDALLVLQAMGGGKEGKRVSTVPTIQQQAPTRSGPHRPLAPPTGCPQGAPNRLPQHPPGSLP